MPPKLIVLLHLFISCALSAQNTIRLKIILQGTPAYATVQPKTLKYGKQGVFSIDFDDRARDALMALSVMKTHSDGAGNQVKYTAGVASNSVTANGTDYSAVGNALTLSELKVLVDANWGLSCHGYYHSIPSNQNMTVWDNVLYNRRYHYDKLKELGTDYIIRTGIVPGADAGYHQAWEVQQFLAGTSQNAFDQYTAIPFHDWWNQGIGDITNLGNGYHVFARRFAELTSQAAANEWKNSLAALMAQSNTTSAKILRYGLHSADAAYFNQVLEFIEQNSQDRIWVTSFHELMEYFETKNKTVISQSLSGNVLTVTLDQSQLPDANRWRDLSLQLNSNATIQSVEVTAADGFSYNSTSGLINVFKKKTVHNHPDLHIVLPIRFTDFTVKEDKAGRELKWKIADAANLSYFEVEGSADGWLFVKVATTRQNSFEDKNNKSLLYYRIKAVGTDGKKVYSGLQKVVKQINSTSGFVYKKGEGVVLHFQSVEDGIMPVLVNDITGRIVYSTSQKVQKGWNTVTIPSMQSKGIFIVAVLQERVKFTNL